MGLQWKSLNVCCRVFVCVVLVLGDRGKKKITEWVFQWFPLSYVEEESKREGEPTDFRVFSYVPFFGFFTRVFIEKEG